VRRAGAVAAAVHQLRRFGPESAEPIDRVAAAAEVLGEALERLRRTSAAQFAVPSLDVALDLGDHARRSRLLADLFDEAARRFEATQDAAKVTLPSVFSRYAASFVGPVPPRAAVARGRAAQVDAAWLATRMSELTGRSPSVLARQIAAQLRRKLGLLDDHPYVVEVVEHRIRLGGDVPIVPGLSVGGAVEQVWTIVELSDGTARATLSLRRAVTATAGDGARVEVTTGGSTLGFDQRTTATIGAGALQGWTRAFASRAEAEEAMADGRLDGFEALLADAADSVLPGASWLVDRLDGDGGMRDAPRTARSLQVAAAASANLSVAAGGSIGPSVAASGTVTLTEERDRDAATTTDVLAVDADVPAALVGALGLAVAAGAASVAVTRDASGGAAGALTVNLVFEGAPGLRPELRGGSAAASAATASVASAGSGSHRYDVTVEVDLDDPRNGPIADGLAAEGPAAARVDEDIRAVARAADLGDDVLARSRITVLEQAPAGSSGVSVDGLPIEGAVATIGWRTVQAWVGVDGRLQPA